MHMLIEMLMGAVIELTCPVDTYKLAQIAISMEPKSYAHIILCDRCYLLGRSTKRIYADQVPIGECLEEEINSYVSNTDYAQ